VKGKICEFCHWENHTIKTCYFRNGFPENFKFKSKKTGNPSNIGSGEGSAYVSAVVTPVVSSISLTKDDYNMLIDMLRKVKPQNSESAVNHTSLTHTNKSPQAAHTNNKGIDLMIHTWIIDS
jgi:hypothetical protein